MPSTKQSDLIRRRYRDVFGAAIQPAFGAWREAGSGDRTHAALGYRRAGAEPLFLEAYLDQPVEEVILARTGRPVARGAIVEIGNFASDNAMAMIALWGAAANDLGGSSEVAVATLTAPLRGMFARIGVPVVALAPADPARLGASASAWGSYYATDPHVCMGDIADGQRAIAAFVARRATRKAA